MEKCDCIVVGAGVIGLAVARRLALDGREVVVLESGPNIGEQTSSRNSGVIHAGIYYPCNSLKAKFCVQGKLALYEFCDRFGVEHSRVGKVLVATEESQLETLQRFQHQARDNGVDDLVPLTADEVYELEPDVRCLAGLWSPSTGIIDAHSYMLALLGEGERHGVVVAFNTPFVEAACDHQIVVQTGGDEPMTLETDLLINCAGLQAQTLARQISGLASSSIPPSYFAKGNYYYLTQKMPFRHLVYPMPAGGSLGVHVSFDLGGRCRFGPDIHWVDKLDYAVDTQQLDAFYDAIRRYWPGLQDGALQPDYTGIRPKLTGEGEPAADFYIQTSETHHIDGLINLYGIESPGLTSSLAIADHVRSIALRYNR